MEKRKKKTNEKSHCREKEEKGNNCFNINSFIFF